MMIWQEMVMDMFDRIASQLAQVLDGLSPEELNLKPTADSGSIGWLAWRLSRSQDVSISEMMKEQQLWIAEGWHARYSRNPDPLDTGSSYRPEEMAEFSAPDSMTIMRYHRAVLERTRDYIGNNLSELSLEEDSYSPVFDRSTPVYRRLTEMINSGFQFAGQAGYVRGLIQGYNWQRR